jgi:hypothetical protein
MESSRNSRTTPKQLAERKVPDSIDHSGSAAVSAFRFGPSQHFLKKRALMGIRNSECASNGLEGAYPFPIGSYADDCAIRIEKVYNTASSKKPILRPTQGVPHIALNIEGVSLPTNSLCLEQ